MRLCTIVFVLMWASTAHAYSFVTIGGGANELRTTYSMRIHDDAFPENDITMVGYRWQITFGGCGERSELYGQFRGFDSQRERLSHVTRNEQGYQTVSLNRWQLDRALVAGYRGYIAQAPNVTILLGGGVLLGLGRGHQQEKQTTTIVHEDHSRETTVDYTYEIELGGLKAGVIVDFGSRIKLSNYLFLETLFESGLGGFVGFPFPSSSSRPDDREHLSGGREVSFNVNLRWDMGKAIDR